MDSIELILNDDAGFDNIREITSTLFATKEPYVELPFTGYFASALPLIFKLDHSARESIITVVDFSLKLAKDDPDDLMKAIKHILLRKHRTWIAMLSAKLIIVYLVKRLRKLGAVPSISPTVILGFDALSDDTEQGFSFVRFLQEGVVDICLMAGHDCVGIYTPMGLNLIHDLSKIPMDKTINMIPGYILSPIPCIGEQWNECEIFPDIGKVKGIMVAELLASIYGVVGNGEFNPYTFMNLFNYASARAIKPTMTLN